MTHMYSMVGTSIFYVNEKEVKIPEQDAIDIHLKVKV